MAKRNHNRRVVKPDIPEAIRKHIGEQEMKVFEVVELLEFLEQHENSPIRSPISLAVRALREIGNALDSTALASVAEG